MDPGTLPLLPGGRARLGFGHPTRTLKTYSHLRQPRCPRQDSNLRLSAPEADSTRLLAFASVWRQLALASRKYL
jgi:hypothetical protein